ncbi:MAG: Smr/MutS family protein [Hyphomicrobiaceae bacterium]
MSSGGGRGRRIKTGLSEEEQELWDHAAASMKPLRRSKGRVLDGVDEAVFEPVAVKARKKGKTVEGVQALPGLPAVPAVAKTAAKTPDLAAFDRKSARRIRSGQIEIDARIDLHGMYQDEAHAALRRFLFSCYSNGARWVLVITGKGAPRRTGWFFDDGDAHTRDHGRDEPRGVLRRNVPRWLGEPELRAIVVSYTQAAIGHGGEGAMYVQLRRR